MNTSFSHRFSVRYIPLYILGSPFILYALFGKALAWIEMAFVEGYEYLLGEDEETKEGYGILKNLGGLTWLTLRRSSFESRWEYLGYLLVLPFFAGLLLVLTIFIAYPFVLFRGVVYLPIRRFLRFCFDQLVFVFDRMVDFIESL